MKILIIGNGGREHALAWKVAQSSKVTQVFVAPGNAGTALELKVQNVAITPTAVDELVAFAKQENIVLTIVGPEAALAAGVVDAFQREKLLCFGPTQAAARLETSKAFSKNFMRTHQIPTAHYEIFSEFTPALHYAQQQSFPIVIKADGLAAGKGVVIATTLSEAENALKIFFSDHYLNGAGKTVVIEEFLKGEELSFIALAHDEMLLPLAGSQDHKRRDNGDQGPNTGGMGAYSPVPLLTETLQHKIIEKIMRPTLQGLKKQGTPYSGFLYAGLMITPQNEPKVLEFNCRLGDPETQVIMMRLQSDLANLCLSALNGNLEQETITWDSRAALTVVLAAEGYPNEYRQGERIDGLTHPTTEGIKIFHAGTLLKDKHVFTSGGRVLTVTALGDTLKEAQDRAYQEAAKIHWPGYFYRTDIGYRALSPI